MDRLSNKTQKLIINLFYASLVFSLAYILGLGIRLKLNIGIQAIIVIIGSTLVKFFLFHPLVLYILIVVGFLGTALVHRYITPVFSIIIEKTYSLFDNIINNIQGKEIIEASNILPYWIILVILVSSFTAFILFKNKKINWLLPLYISSFVYYWYNHIDLAYGMLALFLVIYFILMSLDKYCEIMQKTEVQPKNEYSKLYTPWLKTAIIYSISIVILALVLPKSYQYVKWSWMQKKVTDTFPFVEKMRSYDEYSRNRGKKATLFNFSIIGYEKDDSRLGGPLDLSDKRIMTVRAKTSNYLRGIAKHIYTGDSWRTVTGPENKFRLRDDFSGLSKEEKEMYFEEEEITIIYHSFASTTLFSPYMPYKVNFNGSYYLNVSRDSTLYFPNGVYDGEGYIVSVLKPRSYETLLAQNIYNSKKDIENLDIYLQIPEDKITDRTRELVKEIVKDLDGDYQKAVAIERYLRNNYRYNEDVSFLPENRDFVDFFLFDEKEGYCTHFATTMAMMLRLEGIPCRYIEGYIAQDLVKEGVYEVKHENAHAWVEAFIEPIGWMTFEATPVYSTRNRLDDFELDLTDEILSRNESLLDARELHNFIDEGMNEDDAEVFSNEGIDQLSNSSYENKKIDFSSIVIRIILWFLILIIPFRFLKGFILYKLQESRIKKYTNNEKIIYFYNQILKLTKALGYPQKSGETHNEYADRIAYNFYYNNEGTIKKITDIFVRSKYSNAPSSDEEVIEVEKYRDLLQKRFRNHCGPIVYYYRKYVKAIFLD